MSKIYPEILDKKRREIFGKLSKFKNCGYLAGGTALALQIKHRKSLDFDIFVQKAITNHLRLKAKRTFGKVNFYINTGDQISFTIKDDVSVTLVWYYHKNLTPLVKTNSISLASVLDIAADKAHTIGRRAAWRDYVDLFFLLKKGIVDLRKVINLSEKKFKGEFNEALFLDQLIYYGDLKVAAIEFFKEPHTPSEIKGFLRETVARYLRERRKDWA